MHYAGAIERLEAMIRENLRGLGYDIKLDAMMALSEELQLSFEEKLSTYQEERKMPLLTNIERRTIKKTEKKNIIKLVQVRFGNIPETLIENINKIDDISLLEQFLVSTISVSSLEEFAQLVNSYLPEA